MVGLFGFGLLLLLFSLLVVWLRLIVVGLELCYAIDDGLLGWV